MVDADPAGKASPPIRPRQLLEVVGIKSEQVVGIVSERVVGITLDQVVAIKSEWVVGPSWNPHDAGFVLPPNLYGLSCRLLGGDLVQAGGEVFLRPCQSGMLKI